jgi:hypothetical protein
LNALVGAMIEFSSLEALSFEGYPTERGLYETALRALNLHGRISDEKWDFIKPDTNTHSKELVALWSAADKLLQPGGRISLAEIFGCWSAPPFGLRRGVLGVLGLAYILTNRDAVAAYKEGTYQPDIDRNFGHEVLRDPGCIELQLVVHDENYASLLKAYKKAISNISSEACVAEPLAVGRALVRFAIELPVWAKRTASLPSRVTGIRKILLNAADPHKLLFVDIPHLYETEVPLKIGQSLSEDLTILRRAHPELVQRLCRKLFKALAANPDDLETLHIRANLVKGLSGDFKLESFSARLSIYDSSAAAMEGLISLAVNLPPKDWSDATAKEAELALADLALKFRHAEMLAAVKDRSPTRHAVGLVFGTGEQGRTVMRAIDVGVEETKAVREMAENILNICSKSTEDERLFLAAIAEVGSILLEKEH